MSSQTQDLPPASAAGGPGTGASAGRTVGRSGRFVREQAKRFKRAPSDPLLHEERGLGFRASWREGAEKLVLQREPVTARLKRRFAPKSR
jgi:hypothetical protein